MRSKRLFVCEIVLFGLCSLAGTGRVSGALVVDFESAPTAAGCYTHGSTLTTQGMTFTAVSAGSNGLISCDGTDVNIGSNGTSSLADNNSAPDIDMQTASGAPFDLLSLDVSELLVNAALGRNATQIGVGGFPAGGGGPLQALFNLDGTVDGPGGNADFQTFQLPTTFVNLTKAKITFTLGGLNGSEFLIDNINLQIVPEPSALVLTSIGLLGWGWWRRR